MEEGGELVGSEAAEGVDTLGAEQVHDGDAAELAPPVAVGAESHVAAVVERAPGGALLGPAAEDVVLRPEHGLCHGCRGDHEGRRRGAQAEEEERAVPTREELQSTVRVVSAD